MTNPPKSPANPGIHCPACNHLFCRVIDSRPNGNTIRRRRRCEQCKTKFTTYEVAPNLGASKEVYELVTKVAESLALVQTAIIQLRNRVARAMLD